MTSTPPMSTTSMTTSPLTPTSPSSTASLGEELSALLDKAKQASFDIYEGGKGEGPLCLGWVTEDMFDQLSSDFSSAWRLSWGLTSSMGEALRQEDQGLVGQTLFWGDPTPIHERTIRWLHTKVCQQLKGYVTRSGGSTTSEIAKVKLTEGATREVRLLKEPDDCYLGSARTVTTTMEVAWGNETLTQLVAEVNKWAESGRNAVGLKVWHSSDGGASILVLLQAQNSSDVQVWRYGQKAEQSLDPCGKRSTAVAIVERPEPAAIVPGDWFTNFGNTEQTLGVDPPPVVWSLSQLAALVEEMVADRAEDEATGIERQRILAARKADAMQREARLSQKEIKDIRCAEGISEEVREKLLSEREEKLRFYRKIAGCPEEERS